MKTMLKTMRWFGDDDPTTLADIKQCGAEGVVTALHQIPVGEVWPVEAIKIHQEKIRKAGLEWSVVESLPVHEDIKRGIGKKEHYILNYKKSIENLATCGIFTVTYNFMPVLDWVRTNHQYKNEDGTEALAYEHTAFTYFDICLLKRPYAEKDYDERTIANAKSFGAQLNDKEKERLFRQVLLGLPGSTKNFTAEEVLDLLRQYERVDDSTLRKNLIYFLELVTPTAERVAVNLAIHPDDPPFPVLGLPRVVSTAKDLEDIFSAVPSIANGLCYCTGSLGAHPDNKVVDILQTHAKRIHFLHLRNVIKEPNGDFRESLHLAGDNPMEVILKNILAIMAERDIRLPMRPDHGFLHTVDKDKNSYPGYSLTGRLNGLAALSGLEKGILSQKETLQKNLVKQ